VTGLRIPCGRIDDYCPGLLDQVRTIRNDGSVDRRAGIMGIVIVGGRIAPGEQFSVVGPPSDGLPLVVV
jgi:MOSC domain-containing protein YiiM